MQASDRHDACETQTPSRHAAVDSVEAGTDARALFIRDPTAIVAHRNRHN
jgi:hypothetical protein